MINLSLLTSRSTRFFLIISLLLSLLTSSPPAFAAPSVVVAITQIVEHQALDDERAGILEALEKQGYIPGRNLKVIYENAQGNITTAAQIATKFASLRPDVVVAISTPSAQALAKALQGQEIPLVFSAVTDPVGAKLANAGYSPKTGITGVSDYVQAHPQLQLMQKIIPHLVTVGIIYNPGEVNSVTLVAELQKQANKMGLKLVLASAGKTCDIPGAVHSLIGKVQAIFIPNDNTAVAAMESIVRLGIEHQIPVFAGDVGSVKKGAIATIGYDRHSLGLKAGELVVRILKGAKPDQLPIAKDHPLQVTVNPVSAKKMGITVPSYLLKTAQQVGEGT